MAGRAVRSTGGPLQESVWPVTLAVTVRLSALPCLRVLTNHEKETVMNDPNTTLSEYERDRQIRAQLSERNKAAVFDTLATASIERVLVEFDGEGDSGQINSVTGFCGKERTEFPKTTVSVQEIACGNTTAVSTQTTLECAIETLCYDYLEVTHGGWENNDGAFGEFHFDVAARTIDLEFYGRFTDTYTSNHTF
jgi:hypothetical protein